MHIIPSSYKLFLMGDYHRHEETLNEKLKAICADDVPSALVILGDYDVHSASDIDELRELLTVYPIDYYLLRGNHDNPVYWQDRGIAPLFENPYFHLLEDVDCLRWNNIKFLTVNGAISVDRTCVRHDMGNCWPKEEPVPTDAIKQIGALIKDHGTFDVLLSHTGIISGKTIKSEFTKSFASTDETLLGDLEEEKKLMQKIQIASGVKEHYFGHFHTSWTGEEYGIDCRCLDICELTQL